MVLYILGGVLFLAFGIFLFCKPDLFWRITEQWKSFSDGEPSDLYRISTKFGGVMFAAVGIGMLLLPFLTE